MLPKLRIKIESNQSRANVKNISSIAAKKNSYPLLHQVAWSSITRGDSLHPDVYRTTLKALGSLLNVPLHRRAGSTSDIAHSSASVSEFAGGCGTEQAAAAATAQLPPPKAICPSVAGEKQKGN